MNFGTCQTPDCDYRSEMDSDYCLLCTYVMRNEAEKLQLNAARYVFGEFFGAEFVGQM